MPDTTDRVTDIEVNRSDDRAAAAERALRIDLEERAMKDAPRTLKPDLPHPPRIYLRAALVWLALTVAMVLNGTLRELTYQPLVGYEWGHGISCLTGIAIIFAIARPFVLRHPGLPRATWIGVGLLWLGLTIAFEFGIGYFVSRNSWEQLLADYNLPAGRLWVLVLLAALIAPFFWSMREKGRGEEDNLISDTGGSNR
jgi:hypothetical protein